MGFSVGGHALSTPSRVTLLCVKYILPDTKDKSFTGNEL